ncbi:RNB domain-containing protein [Acetobacter orientalis]|uniref:RNB domain-containing protein n=1 Tax=Acetobacter orientalis TaxID=146474 RepID=A0A2Z5ZGS6_9PROT|nr:RNB domain-containing protein [Acetobacter orientalis]
MRKGKAAAALPGHEVIYRILEEGNAPMGLADILRALGLPLHLKTALRASLHDMALAGVLARLPAGRLKAITGLPEIARATVTRLRADGAAYAHLTTAPDINLLLVAGLPDGTILLPGDDVLVRIRPYIAPHLRREGGLFGC